MYQSQIHWAIESFRIVGNAAGNPWKIMPPVIFVHGCVSHLVSYHTLTMLAQIQFFSHMTVIKVVTPESLLGFLQNISQALEELGASTGRLFKAATCITEGLMRVSAIIASGTLYRASLFAGRKSLVGLRANGCSSTYQINRSRASRNAFR